MQEQEYDQVRRVDHFASKLKRKLNPINFFSGCVFTLPVNMIISANGSRRWYVPKQIRIVAGAEKCKLFI